MLRAAIERAWWLPQATLWSRLLGPLAALYRLLWRGRAWLYRSGARRAAAVGVPVVVVGNLVVGGAGKTPTVIALVRALRQRGWTPGVVSRGYGSRDGHAREVRPDSRVDDSGDEPLLIRLRSGAPVWVGRDRVEAARRLLAANPQVDLIVADDGLQHLPLARDLQIVVFDERGIGNGRLLPAGPLREPMGDAPSPHTLVLYNAGRPTTTWPGAIARRRLAGATPLAAWWDGSAPEADSLERWRGQRVLAAAGIASPARFFEMLESEGLAVDPLALPDHAPLDPRPWAAGTSPVFVTEKDAVKLRPDAADAGRIVVVTLDFELPPDLLADLDGRLDTRRHR